MLPRVGGDVICGYHVNVNDDENICITMFSSIGAKYMLACHVHCVQVI